jgi:hypothetical protein
MTNKDSTNKHQGWVASLSNGETEFERPIAPGEKTAWRQLIERCEEEGIWITQIQLQIKGAAWVGLNDADGYCFFRDYHLSGIATGHKKEKHMAGIGSVVGDLVYCTVVNAENQAQQDVRPLASMRAHCVLKPAS